MVPEDHVVIEHDAIQMIQFMLESDGRKSLEPHFKFLAIRVERFHRYSSNTEEQSRRHPDRRKGNLHLMSNKSFRQSG